MKKSYLLGLSLIVAIAASIFFLMSENEIDKKNTSGGGEQTISGRMQWELERHRDPKTGKIPQGIHRAVQQFVSTLPGSLGNIHTKYDRLLSDRWNRRGPYNIGGRTRALALDIQDENRIIAGGVSGGVWRSDDAGQSWQKTTLPNQLHSVSCIVQDTRPGKQNNWYYGTGELWGNSAGINGDGMFRSTDGGHNWFPIASTALNSPNSWDNKFEFIWNIALNHKAASDKDEIYAATALGGIHRSTDAGNTWTTVLGGWGNPYSLFSDIAISPNGVFYASLSQMSVNSASSAVSGIYRSTDGINWKNITPENFPPEFKRIVIGISPSDERQVYFFAETPNHGKWTTNSQQHDLWHSLWKYTYLSGDGTGAGAMWENRSASLPKPELIRGHINSQTSYNMVIAVKPDNPNVVVIGAVALYRADDGWSSGEFTWIGGTCPDATCDYTYRYTNHHADQHAINFSRLNPNIMFTGTDGGVHKTLNVMSDKVEWISLNNGYFTTQYYSLAIEPNTPEQYKIVGGLQDNGTLFGFKPELTHPWTDASRGDGFCCAMPDSKNYFYTSQNSSYQPKIKVWRVMNDANGNKLYHTRLDPIGGQDFIWNTPFLLDPNNQSRMYLAGGAIVWRNNNLDEIPFAPSEDSTSVNWDSLTHTRQAEGKVTALGISNHPANVLYYGTSEGKVFRINDVDKGDPQPIDITSNLFPQGANTGCIAVDPDNADDVFVAFTNYNIQSIFRTTDGGVTWISVSGNLEERADGSGSGPAVHWIEILPIGERRLYLAGTSAGLFSTAFPDGQYTVWTQEGANTIGNMVINQIASRRSDGYVAVGTHGAGVYTANITSLPPLPKIPSLVYPADGARGFAEKMEFKWNKVDDAFYYKLEIAKDADFQEIVRTVDGLTDDKCQVLNLDQGYQKHYWRVIAKNPGGQAVSAQTWSFTTAIAPPVLAFPEHKSEKISQNPTLKWNQVNGAVSYRFQLSKLVVFTNPVIDTVITSAAEVSVKDLIANKLYFWRVKSIDADGEGVFSDEWNFRTTDASSVQPDKKIEAILYQNYPNPFSNSSIIEFELKQAGMVNLAIYDLNGRKIKQLLNRYFDVGRNSVKIFANELPQGKYYYRLVSGSTVLLKSLNVVK